ENVYPPNCERHVSESCVPAFESRTCNAAITSFVKLKKREWRDICDGCRVCALPTRFLEFFAHRVFIPCRTLQRRLPHSNCVSLLSVTKPSIQVPPPREFSAHVLRQT